MPTAFVLINTEIGSESDVLKELKRSKASKKLLPFMEFTTL